VNKDTNSESPKRGGATFEEILDLVKFLRSPSGCSWDREQDERSLIPFFLEECHELAEAIDSGDAARRREELGDILLHCAFLIEILEEKGEVKKEEIIGSLLEKMRRRHPHLFGGEKGEHGFDWETIKRNERERKGMESITDGLPSNLPSLLAAFRLQARVSSLNFDWHEPTGAFDKVKEELEEVKEKWKEGDRAALEIEIGDLLFAVVNVSRLLGFHPENALRLAIRKFAARFDRLMEIARKQGMDIMTCSLMELDAIWDGIKEDEERGSTKEV
jgi:MazG family protein